MKIHHGLANGQVLQRLGSRGATATLTGESRATGEVIATIHRANKSLKGWTSRKVGKVAKGKFTIRLENIPNGGPYRLTLKVGAESTTVKAFYVGDVWLLAGQSNMQGIGNLDEAAKSHPLIRAFSLRREWRLAEDPLHILEESPDRCHSGHQISPAESEKSRRTAVKGTGPGIFFAREMLQRTGVPQGLMCTAHGGTSMAQWDPALKSQGGESFYFSMLESVKATGQPVAGLLWYQGESDCNPELVPLYVDRMKKLVAASRRDLRQPKLPWIVVQISRLVGEGNGETWNLIREFQRQLPAKISALDTVSAIDLSMDDLIHISGAGFAVLGTRLASSAARLVLGDKRELPSPQFLKVHPLRQVPGIGWTQEVEFTAIKGKLISAGEPQGFSYVDRKHQPHSLVYRTKLVGNRALLYLNTNPEWEDLSIGYGLGFNPVCNVTDERGSALPAFGPVEAGKPAALLPFLTEWKVTDVLPAAQPLAKLKCPDLASIPHQVKTYTGGNFFVNEHDLWLGKTGQVYFAARLELSEPMKLNFRMGYDGPFRLWLNGKPFFQDLEGTNPAMVDSKIKSAALGAGVHDLTVAMDINHGLAWGFFLRFERTGMSPQTIRAGDFAKPIYRV